MIRIIAGGKKSLSWVAEACLEYEKRLRKPFELNWRLVNEEKLELTVLKDLVGVKLGAEDAQGSSGANKYLIILDERGKMLDSPTLSKHLAAAFELGREIVLVIGGAYGISEELRARADLVWSLSDLVFPHQICRLLVTEQIYRAQEIYHGRPYHHF